MKRMFFAVITVFLAFGSNAAIAQTRPAGITDVRDIALTERPCTTDVRVEMPMSSVDELSDEGEAYVVKEAIKRFCTLATRPTVTLSTVYEGKEPIVVPKATAGTAADVTVPWRIRGTTN